MLEKIQSKATNIISHAELQKKLALSRPLRVKYGIDPTSPFVHLGHTVPLRLLRQFQDAGHKAVLVLGDFTAAIGDPTGRDAMRPPMTLEQARDNSKTYLKQIGKVIDINKAEVHINSNWFERYSFQDCLTRLAKVTVQRLLERDDFQKRLREQKPIYMHETLYPLMQGEDSVRLEADIELGGSEQLFALHMGRQMQMDAGQEPQVCITLPILVGLDGEKKMGKSLGNFIGVDEEPFEMYSKVMSIPDHLVGAWYHLLTDVADGGVPPLFTSQMEIKKTLASNIVSWLHGKTKATAAAEEWHKRFTLKEMPTEIPEVTIDSEALPLFQALFACSLVSSKSDARRMVEQGAVQVDGNKISDPWAMITLRNGMVLQIGRRKFVKVRTK